MTADNMVERVARAICTSRLIDPDSTVYYGVPLQVTASAYTPIGEPFPAWRLFISEARTAVAAMREPTEAMLDAGGSALSGMTFNDYPRKQDAALWQAMIDAVLVEVPPS